MISFTFKKQDAVSNFAYGYPIVLAIASHSALSLVPTYFHNAQPC
jgi:hypothetical protein